MIGLGGDEGKLNHEFLARQRTRTWNILIVLVDFHSE